MAGVPDSAQRRPSAGLACQPPLLPGWTEHVGPQGQLYWHNAQLNQSTYQRPTAPIAGPPPPGYGTSIYTGPPPGFPSGLPDESIPSQPSKPKKEKPEKKVPIPGADGWLRVTTNMGNTFYTHKESKRSEWTIPDEIRSHVEAMDAKEREAKKQHDEQANQEREKQERERREADARVAKEQRLKLEEERIRMEKEQAKRAEQMRKQQEEQTRIQEDRQRILQEASKRKREAEQDGTTNGGGEVEKRARIGDETADEDDEETWQRKVAEEMATEAEAQASREEAGQSGAASMATPSIELSLEEGKAIFMHMLTALNGTTSEINPMAPWDRELPKFVNHRDYTVLNFLRDRQDAFNEWCRLRLREKRKGGPSQAQNKMHAAQIDTPGSPMDRPNPTAHVEQNADAVTAYRQLLEHEVTSTRARWEDFRKAWKRDRRFFAYGRDDREREKAFRGWLKELGERKRKAAERAESDFVRLLAEHLSEEFRLSSEMASTEEAQKLWSKAKKSPGLDRDPRYDAVGSSSRRAELFEEWARGKRSTDQPQAVLQDVEPAQSNGSKHRHERDALREREEQVRRQQRQVEHGKTRSFGRAVHDESRTNFQQLLLDAVRDPLARMPETFADLSRDERFRVPGLSEREKEDLFYAHLDKLNDRRLQSLEEVFARHAPALDVKDEVALPLIKHDDEIARRELNRLQSLASGRKTVEILFGEWKARREKEAKDAFVQMLKENAFVEFWGRLRQEHEQKRRQTATGQSQTAAAMGEDDDDEDADVPSLLQMAVNIDLEEVHSILRDDQRYRAFRHKPEERERWIREYLQTMEIPKKTVFQQH